MEEEGGAIGSINLSRKDEEDEVDISGEVHQLPCCIKFNGSCPVSHYFKPRSSGTEVDELRVEEAYFRGRKLQGTTISIPNGYFGFVLGKKSSGKRKASDAPEGDTNHWEMKAKFDRVAYWNEESLPSKDDSFLRCFHWFAVAEALHKPVKAEDLATDSLAPGSN